MEALYSAQPWLQRKVEQREKPKKAVLLKSVRVYVCAGGGGRTAAKREVTQKRSSGGGVVSERGAGEGSGAGVVRRLNLCDDLYVCFDIC